MRDRAPLDEDPAIGTPPLRLAREQCGRRFARWADAAADAQLTLAKDELSGCRRGYLSADSISLVLAGPDDRHHEEIKEEVPELQAGRAWMIGSRR